MSWRLHRGEDDGGDRSEALGQSGRRRAREGAPRRATSVAPRGETCVAEGVDEVSREAAAVRAGEVVVPGS